MTKASSLAAEQDEYTIQQYTTALIRGENLPPISVEATDGNQFRVLKGVLRYQAYRLRRDIYTEKAVGDFYDEPLPTISESDDLNALPCILEVIPPNTHPMVFCMIDNLKHGKPMTSADYRRVARQVYTDNEGAAIIDLAKIAKMDRKTFAKHTRDLEEAFLNKKKTMILELDAEGVIQTEICRKLQERFPKADSFSQPTISAFISKMRNVDTTNNQAPPEDADGPESTPKNINPESSQAPPPKFNLRVTGTAGDAIMIRGVLSLPLPLQEELRKEAVDMVDRFLKKALGTPDQEFDLKDHPIDESEQTPNSLDEIEPESKPAEKTIDAPSQFISVFRPTKGGRPVSYSA